MKPEIGLTDMDDKVYDPRVLFAEVGLLITEARTPEISKKGRIEGPHCPPITGLNEHECDRHKEQCRKASDIINQQDILWQNKIPMRIDVLLFPDCKHGQYESSVVEGTSLPPDEHFELLERWDVQLVKKRSPERMEGFVKGRIHLQAVRSFLHFSQLSSWLISMHGAIPFKTVYRIYAPGESVGPSFSRLPEVHNFPSADLGDVIMRTTCAFLPRQQDPIILLCQSPSSGFESFSRTKKLPEEDAMLGTRAKSKPDPWEPVPSTSKYADEMDKKMDGEKKSKMKSKQKEYEKELECLEMECQVMGKPPYGPRSKVEGHTRSKVEGHSKGKLEHSLTCPVSIAKKRKVDQMSPTMQDVSKYVNDPGQGSSNMNTSDVAMATKPTVIQVTTSSNIDADLQNPTASNYPGHTTPTKSKQLKKPATLCVAVSNSVMASKRLPSPKVLLTASSKPEPSTFKKRCLDLDKPECIAEKDPEFDDFDKMNEFTASDICDLIKPPSLGELEAYLSSLSKQAPRKQTIQDIPTTKCRFYMDDCEIDTEGGVGYREEGEENIRDYLKNPNFRIAQSLSERSDCVTPTQPGGSKDNNHVKTLFVDSDLDTNNGLNSHIRKSQLDKGSIVKNQESYIEPQSHTIATDNETTIGTSKTESNQTSSYSIKSSLTLAKENRDVESLNSEKCKDSRKNTKKYSKERIEKEDSSSISDLQKKDEGYQFSTTRNSIKTSETSEHSSERNGKSLHEPSQNGSDISNISNGNGQSENHSQTCLSQEVNRRTSKRERTLNELSIPCNIGAVENAMTTLAQNLESMDIDDRPYSPFSRNSSPTLDHEVEKHLTPKLNIGKASCESGKVSGQTSRSTSLTPSPETCDTSSSPTRGLSLCKQLLRKEFQQNVQKEIACSSQSTYKSLPSPDDIKNFQYMVNRSASVVFNTHTGLPSRSSPAPIKKISSNKFDYDCSLTNVKAIKNAISCSKLTLQSEDNVDTIEDPRIISTSAPAATNCLLGNFEESVLNGRIEPVGVVDGFSVEIGAGGTFCPKHVSLPVAAYFFQLSEDNAPSPYLGHVNLEPLGKRGYHIPRTGTVQMTLFNPNKTVVKMFVVMYDLSDMPANCQTFLRQRTLYMPVDPNSSQPSFLRYLIHLRFQSSKSGKIYLHTDIRLIFARDKFEFDPRVANYELRSFTEGPENPKFSPKK